MDSNISAPTARRSSTRENSPEFASIPPAYQDVWICPFPNGHLQATGRDARGRKQYRYHPRWRAVRDEGKYGKMLIFGKVLPAIRAQVEHDLSKRGLPREKVLGAIVRLLGGTKIRVGNEEYARTNNSFGLTTLRNRHVKVAGDSRIRFDFRGKSGTEHHINLHDRKLATIVRRCQELPGQELFQYLDDEGQPHALGSDDVKEYLREITGEEITAKDFRTWAARISQRYPCSVWRCSAPRPRRKNVLQAVEAVAKMLGNTPRSAVNATSIPRSSTAISTARCLRLSNSAQMRSLPTLAMDCAPRPLWSAFWRMNLKIPLGRR
jgi:DNA topoisomerase-1